MSDKSQCTFWCSVLSDKKKEKDKKTKESVSMHLLVLSAFRRRVLHSDVPPIAVSMHLLVLSAFRPCLGLISPGQDVDVSMHLLVLSAFRLKNADGIVLKTAGLNAPFGAQCFPTRIERTL